MSERVLMCGNEALAEAAIIAGVDAYFGYPITPQNEITAYMSRRMAEEGRVFIQSESELAAINMVFGAAATGKRSMTSSSSPGISLMQEGISFLAGAELPAVIVNVMRGGPGLGNIGPSQADYFQATRGGGHGDYRTIVWGPSTVQELVDCSQRAFDQADLYRIPVMILADGILGQMMEPIQLNKLPACELPEKDWALTGAQGRQQNIVRSLWLKEGALEGLNRRLQAKYELIQSSEVSVELYQVEDAQVIIVAYGIAVRLARDAVEKARAQGIRAGLLRPITLWPFPSEQISELARGSRLGRKSPPSAREREIFSPGKDPGAPGLEARASFPTEPRVFLTVELSCGQMLEDVKLAVAGNAPVFFHGRPGGGVPTVEDILAEIVRLSTAVPAHTVNG